MVRVKICGVRNEKEALMAVEGGAEAVGFILTESHRRILPEKASNICKVIPPFVSKVGVFVDEDPGLVKEIAEECRLDILQFHGQEPPSSLIGFKQKVIKAFALKGEESLDNIYRYESTVHAWLLDAYAPGKPGGTGRTFNWSLVNKIIRKKPIILAGGLTEENILQALKEVRPFAVDVSSGVETEGEKDCGKIINFINKVRSWKSVS